MPLLKIKRVNRRARIPAYQSDGAACFDLHALLDAPAVLLPRESLILRTGLAVEMPPGWRMDVFSRSGHGFQHGVTLANSVGKIDADYRNELMVCLYNAGKLPITVSDGDRVAQAELNPVFRVDFEEVLDLSSTSRTGGFGSTGA